MKYRHSRIYQIWNDVNDKIYIGSTTQPLAKRFSLHKSNAKRKPHRPLYKDMLEIGCECFHIELVKEYPCENREQLNRKEGHYIRKYQTHKDGYNTYVAGRTDAEYRNDNQEKILEYREANRDKKAEYNNAYQEANKNKIVEYQKAYYEANQDKINQKIPCPTCEKLINRRNLALHYKRKHPVDED